MFIGGHLSDTYGRRKVLAVTMLCTAPFLWAFLLTQGLTAAIFLMLGMVALLSGVPAHIVLAQSLAPKLAGIASSMITGAAFAVGGLAAPFFGALADDIGIQNAMKLVFLVPIAGGLMVLLLKTVDDPARDNR